MKMINIPIRINCISFPKHDSQLPEVPDVTHL